jgi:hypothetical protein
MVGFDLKKLELIVLGSSRIGPMVLGGRKNYHKN